LQRGFDDVVILDTAIVTTILHAV